MKNTILLLERFNILHEQLGEVAKEKVVWASPLKLLLPGQDKRWKTRQTRYDEVRVTRNYMNMNISLIDMYSMRSHCCVS